MSKNEKNFDIMGTNASLSAEPAGRRSSRLRLRAAWMYYVEEMTQTAIAEALGVGRVTVVRMLADARALNEVKIALRRNIADLPPLEIALERRFGLQEAIVAPISSTTADTTAAIGAATGQFISDFVKPNMRLGVGWGRTLLSTLSFIDETQVPGLEVVSMLGGVSAVRKYNPAEFAWQFSRLFTADCFLISAPALVDSVETKRALIERCGIGDIFEMADRLDALFVSAGGMAPEATWYLFEYFTERDREELIARGAVGDVMYNFFNASGEIVDHPLNQRVMSVGVEQLQKTPHRVLTSGGPDKIEGLLGAMKFLRPTVFITDEITAKTLLDVAGPL